MENQEEEAERETIELRRRQPVPAIVDESLSLIQRRISSYYDVPRRITTLNNSPAFLEALARNPNILPYELRPAPGDNGMEAVADNPVQMPISSNTVEEAAVSSPAITDEPIVAAPESQAAIHVSSDEADESWGTKLQKLRKLICVCLCGGIEIVALTACLMTSILVGILLTWLLLIGLDAALFALFNKALLCSSSYACTRALEVFVLFFTGLLFIWNMFLLEIVYKMD